MSAAAAMALVSVLKKRNGNNSSDAEQPSSEDTVEGLLTLTEEARALVRALQDNDISEEELLRMVNTEPSDFHADNPERAGIIRRARKIFRYLDINNDGVVAPDDLQEVKGRLYQATDPQTDTLQKLRTEFMRNGEAVDAMRSKAKEYLVHREGYALCFGHLAFFAIFIAVLALQLDTSQTWEVRRAITQSVFPSAIFGEDVTMINSIVLTSTDEITDWFEAAFVNSEGVFADPACGDGVRVIDQKLKGRVERVISTLALLYDKLRHAICLIPSLQFCRSVRNHWSTRCGVTPPSRLDARLIVDDGLRKLPLLIEKLELNCSSIQHFQLQRSMKFAGI